MTRPAIPAPLPLSYVARARPIASAEVTVRPWGVGGIEQRIAHAPLPGVTREMLFWWMHHMADAVEWEGHRVKAYRLWHPLDHIDWSCDGPVQAGSRFRIQEAFQREARFLIDSTFDVPRLGPDGFRLETRFFGAALASIDEDWEDVPGGVRWVNTMHLTGTTPLVAPLVRIGRAIKRTTLTAWIRHNVEEVGFLPEFLPALFRRSPRVAA